MAIPRACRAGTKGEPSPMSVGRNELCPCGSGKKYKKCCGVVTPISQLRSIHEQKLRKECAAWIERLNNYVGAQLSNEALQKARERFAHEVGLSTEEIWRPEWMTHFLNWYILDVQTNGTTLLESFIKQHGRKMEHDLRRAFSQLSLGLYEVERVEAEMITVRHLSTGEQHFVLTLVNLEPQAGQIIVGRLLNLGLRDLLFSGSLILQSRLKPAIIKWLSKYPHLAKAKTEPALRTYTTDLYRFIVQTGEKAVQSAGKALIRRVYEGLALSELRQAMEANGSFELKKRDNDKQIWVFAKRKEEYLFPALHNALIELHEVSAELLIQNGSVWVEGFAESVEEIAQALQLPEANEELSIQQLTSTGAKLTRGTLFITSEPVLPAKILQWAVRTYFAEKWLITPHDALTGLGPVLVAASADEQLRQSLAQLIAKIEHEGKLGQGLARFMRIDLLRPRLALPNDKKHIANLLNRPLIEGLPESVYTVQPERLAQMTRFVQEATEGKSEATVKKYDEVMNLFRTFVRSAFGPGFEWNALRREELAYFLVHDVPARTDNATKTLAANLLSVLAAFFKWLDKQGQTNLAERMQPLLGELKEDLPEAYRIRLLLQKEAHQNLLNPAPLLKQAVEEPLLLSEKQADGWLCKRENGERIVLALEKETADLLAPDWIVAGLIGQTEGNRWRLYGTPELYPPAVARMLGVEQSALV
jgi:uncharacterized protein YchJ